jgi:hypothetical protein
MPPWIRRYSQHRNGEAIDHCRVPAKNKKPAMNMGKSNVKRFLILADVLDPGETANRFSGHMERVKLMKDKLEQFKRSGGAA